MCHMSWMLPSGWSKRRPAQCEAHPCLSFPSPPLQIPTIGFIYFAGWLGYAGSKYLQIVKEGAKPIEKEIIIGEPGLGMVMCGQPRSSSPCSDQECRRRTPAHRQGLPWQGCHNDMCLPACPQMCPWPGACCGRASAGPCAHSPTTRTAP